MTKHEMLGSIHRQEAKIAPRLREYAYKAAVYEIRFGEPYKIPFNIPESVLIEERQRAEKDWREYNAMKGESR